MASITIRKLDDSVKAMLRIRAAEHGRSMEEEARAILQAGVSLETNQPEGLFTTIRRYMAEAGIEGVDLPEFERSSMREPPTFD